MNTNTMCDVCLEFQNLLESYEARIASNEVKFQLLLKSEIETAFSYIQSWPQRQCMCLYRDAKNYERFNLVVQSMICLAVHHLKHIQQLISNYKRLTASAAQVVAQVQQKQQQQLEKENKDGGGADFDKSSSSSETSKVADNGSSDRDSGADGSNSPESPTKSALQNAYASVTDATHGLSQHTDEPWILPEVEKLLLLVSKIFLLNFPLYLAYKHGTHARLDDISAEEAQHLAIICDLHDNEIPVYLLRNVCLFCNSGGFAAMMQCFEQADLPVSTAHSITATISNVKLWLNYSCIVQLFVPLRSRILKYMCKLSDQNLRATATRAMADFVWSSIRDPLDASLSFDIEGLALAFKYFTSTTLTMRLAGMAQINAHINLFNEICATETVSEVEMFGQRIANWLTENQIIQHLFGPNLHVEIVKQAHVLLNFLAMENQITEDDIRLIWQATQLKHCSKTVFDILPSLAKSLGNRPTQTLYSLLCRMDTKEHTEQTIFVIAAILKSIWTRDTNSNRSQMSIIQDHMLASNVTASSSDSGSMDGSNSDDEQVGGDDSSIGSGCRKSPMDGVTPSKQARRRRHICDPTTEKAKQLSEEELPLLNPKVDLKLQNHRIVNIIDNTSSEDELQSRAGIEMHRKKSCKRRKHKNKPLPLPHEMVAIWEGGDDEPTSDDVDAEIIADSDDCSDNGDQVMPSAVLKHLQGEGPYIRAIAETNVNELLSGAENDGSYSSPLSNKSDKNMGDFEDEEVSPCEEELAQLVSSHAARVQHNCMPPAFAAAAAAMAVAHSAMQMQKSGDANVAAAAAAVAAAAVATGNAHQSFEVMRQQAAAAAVAKASSVSSSKPSDSDVDITDASKESPKASSSSSTPVLHSFKLADICQPGQTLLWDLLQDDKIYILGESLALEAEKSMATLLCFNVERQIRTKFIEGCLQNLANNRSVIVSLRLLPKIFASFQQFRPSDTHTMVLWAERHHRMMAHFFNNIRYYAKKHAEHFGNNQNGDHQQPILIPFYTHKTQVSARLQFLSSIYSSVSSPKTFRLSLDQVDILWEWLAHDPECSDCYFSWLQSQAKGGEQHALGLEALQHIYLKKLPELRPEDFSMVALALFQQLCSFARIAIAQFEKCDAVSASSNAVGMFHLWKIALRAHNTEVSLAAIQYINMYYMGQQLRLEKEFVSQCMENLVQAANALDSNEDENALMCVQRGLMLLNTHLETFRRRYAFHLRRWAIEGKGIGSHSNLKNEGAGPAIRIVLQQAGLSDKSILHMHACDLIAELKAEISKWWENVQCNTNSGLTAPVLGLLLNDGPLRIITQGQELTSDYDERSLGDAGFKDNQIVYVSLGGRSGRRKDTNIEHPSMQPPPPKECLPTVLLLQPRYFEKLFCLMQTLGDMKPQTNNLQLHTKAQLLSRRVWDILAILPTNPMILDAFKSLGADLVSIEQLSIVEEDQANKRKEIKQKLSELLDPSNLQKFMYSLHIVESLALNSVLQNRSSGGGFCCGGGGVGGGVGGGGVNGNVITTVEHHLTRAHKSGNGSSSSKKSASRRRNSNDSSTSMHKEEAKRSSSGNSSAQESSNKESSDNSPKKDMANKAALSLESSDHSEAGSDARSSNDKENHPSLVKHHSKRQKKSDSMEERVLDSGISGQMSTTRVSVNDPKWSEAFIKCGGLKHLYDIFITGTLQQSTYPKEILNEWRHDCLASLLRILWLLGFEELPTEDLHVIISRPHAFMLELIEVDVCLRRLSTILNDEVYQNYAATAAQYPYQFHHLRTGFWGRAQVVQFAMNILVSFVHASSEARRLLWAEPEYCAWVQKFILEDPEPGVRREICAGLYRICMGNAQSYQMLLAPLLHKLISFLPMAEKMASYTQHTQFLLSEEGKEPYGPACRDYFWLLARLVDTLTPEMINEEAIDIELLCQSVSQSILTRDFHETRHGYQDDGLVGLLNLMSNLIKYDTAFKFSAQVLDFIEKIVEFLFDMPSPVNRQKPKCKSATSRAAAYDLLVELCRGCPKNYTFLHGKLMAQHKPGPKQPYPWDYWPRDEGRAECGYVGLTNLGATCYMASCVQHLYMMPEARAAVLRVPQLGAQKHGPTLMELQRMFAYLLESERKAYNPRSFCRVYQMDHQPLNTGEQKDMAEFFIDLVSKLEEMTPDLKHLVKRLFCGTLSNNVVSLDCGHVSRTAEDFYTVRCQVADMRNLQESLDEVTVKDTLEGDNMYTCSQCGKKVRAEKRACFKKLPQILCFNTMRYTFNMVTMLKEKVNTHFSFPMRLNMSDYVEKTLMPHQYKEDREKRKQDEEQNEMNNGDTERAEASLDADIEECFDYELVGVTVHTGTADGGHYYSFIKERVRNAFQHERWFLFNDAEVKPFDPSQIAAECFGGEMTSKTYDSVTEKYLDFSFEKTNSAYMLFYERRLPEHLQRRHSELLVTPTPSPENNEKQEQQDFVTINKTDETEEEKVVGDSKENNATNANELEAKQTKLHDNGGDVDMQRVNNNEKQVSNNTNAANKSETANCDKSSNSSNEPQASTSKAAVAAAAELLISRLDPYKDQLVRPLLNKDLEDWIWQDNRQFLQDKNIFEHTYFNFMWQICGHIPQTLIAQTDVTCMAAKLSVSFFIETFIHAKEKPTMVPWVELLTKQFNASEEACEWFLGHMSIEPFWPVQVLIQCPNQMVRQMFQRLVIHVIQQLRPTQADLYLNTEIDENGKELVGNGSCVTRFISSLISLMEHGAKPHLRHLSEFFSLLFEFSRMGDEETLFLLRIGVIKSVADFYLGHKAQDNIEVSSDNDDNSSDEALSVEKVRPASLDKMIALTANLVERSRGPDFRLRLSTKDYNAIAGGKGFPFLYQQIKDNINPHQTKHLIHALCRWDERLANQIITMLFASVTKHTELCGPFFKLLTLLTETQGGPTGLPCFSQLVLQRVWDAAEYCPQSALDWLAYQAPKNKIAHAWILQSSDTWVEQYLLSHENTRVRNAAACLLVALVPSQPFRVNFRSHSQHKLSALSSHVSRELNNDAQIILHQIINLLLRLLRPARVYADIGSHGTAKLTAYFGLLSYCMVSKTEKLMIGPYMRPLWELFHPRLSEPSVAAHHNKHALLTFWHHSIVDCPENAQLVANCPEITRNIAFNYILADHDDSEIVSYNRSMLPAYYGMLRLCCEQSRSLTRQLAAHQNLQWAFKNITPHPTQYASAVDELFKLMTLFATRHVDASEQEKHEVATFRRTTLSAYLTSLDARVSWSTLISALKILVDNDEDRLLVIYNGGIEMCFEALHTLHSMHHEATACHVSGDLQELLGELVLLLVTLRISTRLDNPAQKKQQLQAFEQQTQQLQIQQQQLLQKQQLQQQQQQSQSPQTPQQTQQQQKEKQLQQQMQHHLQLQQMQQQLQQQHFLRQQHQQAALVKGLPDAVKRLATLLNTYSSPDICRLSLDVLKELVRNPNLDVTSILAPILINCHLSVANAPNAIGPLGPYFPRRGAKAHWQMAVKNSSRPPRPMVQMSISHNELIQKGVDKDYDAMVEAFYKPYHDFLDVMMRMAVNTNTLNDTLVKLACLVAIEAAPLHFNLFPKFWVGIYNNKTTNKYVDLLVSNQLLVEYIHIILRDERVSLSDQYIRSFLEIYYPKIATQLPIARLLYSISYSMHSKDDLDDLCGDLFAIRVIAQSTGIPTTVRKELRGSLRALLFKSSRFKQETQSELLPNKKPRRECDENNDKESEDMHQDDSTELMETSIIKEHHHNDNNNENDEDDDDDDEDDNDADKENEGKPAHVHAHAHACKANEKNLEEDETMTSMPERGAHTPEDSRASSSDDGTEPDDNTNDNTNTNDRLKHGKVTVNKNTNKKTAHDRLHEEHEKRLKLLVNMDSYIETILSLMKKDSKDAAAAAAAAHLFAQQVEEQASTSSSVAKKNSPELSLKLLKSDRRQTAANDSPPPPPPPMSKLPAAAIDATKSENNGCENELNWRASLSKVVPTDKIDNDQDEIDKRGIYEEIFMGIRPASPMAPSTPPLRTPSSQSPSSPSENTVEQSLAPASASAAATVSTSQGADATQI